MPAYTKVDMKTRDRILQFIRKYEDWSDAKVALHFGVTVTSVKNMRQRVLGSIQPVVSMRRTVDPELVSRVESLERRNNSMLSAIECNDKSLQAIEKILDSHARDLNVLMTKLRSLIED